jgi:hypothetical protein
MLFQVREVNGNLCQISSGEVNLGQVRSDYYRIFQVMECYY